MRPISAILGLLAVLAVVLLFAIGVLYVRNSDDEVNITLDKQKLEERTDEAARQFSEIGGDLLDKTGESLEKAGEKLDRETAEPEQRTITPDPDA